jgi:hypothetical protein
MMKYSDSLSELVVCRSERIERILQSKVTLEIQGSEVLDSRMVVTQTEPKSRKDLRDLQPIGEDNGVRSEQEDEDAESAEIGTKNRSGASRKNTKASLKMEVEFEYDMFSEIAIGRGYDWIESNVDLATPDPMHQFSQFLDRIQVSKITPGMIIPVLSFTQDPPLTTISARISRQYMHPFQMLG